VAKNDILRMRRCFILVSSAKSSRWSGTVEKSFQALPATVDPNIKGRRRQLNLIWRLGLRSNGPPVLIVGIFFSFLAHVTGFTLDWSRDLVLNAAYPPLEPVRSLRDNNGIATLRLRIRIPAAT
jgi:hypothetical protein